jgi:hypothetical protein
MMMRDGYRLSAAGERSGGASPSSNAVHERRHMVPFADCVVNFLDFLAGGGCPLARQELSLELLSDEFVQRIGSAAFDSVRHGGDPLGVVGFADERDFGVEPLLEVLLERCDFVEDGSVWEFLVGRVLEGVVDERLAQLLHERVSGAGGVVDVGEDGLVVDDAEEVLLCEPSGEKGAVRAHEERLLRGLADDVLHGCLHCLLDVAEVDGLAERDQERGAHELENLDGFFGLACGDESKGVHVLVVLLRALDVRGDRVGQVVELGEVGRHGDLGAFHAVVEARVWSAAEVGWQAVVVVVVDELGELREHELADGGHGQAHVVHGDADWSALEVSPVKRPVACRVDERGVVHGVDLSLDGMRCIANHFNLDRNRAR